MPATRTHSHTKPPQPAITYRIPRTIALCGPYEAGKSSVAHLLSLLGYQRFSFGTLVREELVAALHKLPRPIVPLGYDADEFYRTVTTPDVHEAWTALHQPNDYNWIHDCVFAKPTIQHVRVLLQWYGTDYRRNYFGLNYWADQAYTQYSKMIIAGPVVIDDWRFANEDIWKRRKITALRVRVLPTIAEAGADPNAYLRAHESEQHYMKLPVHLVLENNKTIPSMVNKLRDMLVTPALANNVTRIAVKLPRTFPPQV